MLSVVIPTYDRPEALRECVNRLMQQTVSPTLYEIIVVDDASSKPVAPLLAAAFQKPYPEIRWLRIEENNLPRARNLGIAHARGGLVLFVGDDVLAQPNMIEEHIGIHERAPRRVAGLCRLASDPRAVNTAFERFFDPFGFSTLAGDRTLDCRYFWTNNISLSTELLRALGGFDEEFPDANHEDVELGYRLAQAGLEIHFRDRLVGHHYHSYTLESACRLQYRRGLTYHVLRRKVPDAVFREHLGLFSWRNSPRSIVRAIVRSILFNDLTAPRWLAWLSRDEDSPVRRYFYWKLLMYYANKGFQDGRRLGPAGMSAAVQGAR